jgi:hypothetical protein
MFIAGGGAAPEVTLNVGGLALMGSIDLSYLLALTTGVPAKYTITGALRVAGSGSSATVSASSDAAKVNVNGLGLDHNDNGCSYYDWSFNFPNASGDDLVVNTGLNSGQNWGDTPLCLDNKQTILSNCAYASYGLTGRTLNMTAGDAFTDGVSSSPHSQSQDDGLPGATWSPAGWYGGYRMFESSQGTPWYLWRDGSGGQWVVSHAPNVFPSAESGSEVPGWIRADSSANGVFALVYSDAETSPGDLTVTRTGNFQNGPESSVANLIAHGWTVSLNTGISGGGSQ